VLLYAGHLVAAWAIGVSNVLLGLAVLGTGRHWRRMFRGAARPATRLAIAYLALLVAAIAASPEPRTSARAASEIFSFATFGLALVWARGEHRVRWLVDALILTGAILAFWGLGQLGFGYGQLDNRIRGPFSHYMTFSGVLVLVDLLLVARLLRRPRGTDARGPTRWLDRRPVAWTVLVVVTWALLVSLTRGAWIALVVILIGLALLERRRLLLLLVPAAVLFLVLAPVPMVARALSIGNPRDTSTYDRLCMAEAGLRMVSERPLLGIGPERVKHVYPLYRHPTAPRLWVPHLHNAYLQLAAERGIPALSVLLALLGTALLTARRGLRAGGSGADLHLGVLSALGAFAIAALFENNWGDTEVQRLVLFLVAVPFALEDDGGPT
jgi:O-antigen ligase